MGLLMIGHDELVALEKLKIYAEEHHFELDDMLDLMNGSALPAGDRPEYTVMIPTGFKVVYSIEQHPKTKMRHLSMSSPRQNKYPTPTAIRMVARELGFEEDDLSKLYVSVDEQESCVHVMEPLRN